VLYYSGWASAKLEVDERTVIDAARPLEGAGLIVLGLEAQCDACRQVAWFGGADQFPQDTTGLTCRRCSEPFELDGWEFRASFSITPEWRAAVEQIREAGNRRRGLSADVPLIH
jgi:hypothetical protein